MLLYLLNKEEKGYFLDFIVFGIYRIAKGKVVFGLIWIFTGGLFGIWWIIDVVTIVTSNKITFLA